MTIKNGNTARAFIIATLCLILSGCGGKPDTAQLNEPKVQDNVYFENVNYGGLKKIEVVEKVEKYAENINVVEKDAKLDQTTWEVTEKEKQGHRLNIENTIKDIMNSKKGDKIKLYVEEVQPKVTEESLKKNIVLIGNFSTRILDRRDSRMNNIQLASNSLDYCIINPGEEFSFNKALGKRTLAKGYEVAPIIKRTEEGSKKGYGVGGGICQLSSTLFNAVAEGGLEVTERHMHSKNVGYIEKGRDATVSYGSVDFRFRNTREYPVMLRIYAGEKYLTVKVFENRNKTV